MEAFNFFVEEENKTRSKKKSKDLDYLLIQ